MLEKVGDMSTMFSRAEESKACRFGSEGSCCRVCGMGPCNLHGTTKDGKPKTGVCGATLSTVAARNFARSVAAGASAHSDHGRSIALTFLAAAKGEAPGYEIKDVEKLMNVAKYLEVPTEGKTTQEIAIAVGEAALRQFGKQDSEPMVLTKQATKKRQELWKKLDIFPRAFDREVVQLLHQTHAGTDQDAAHILHQTVRLSLASGWGGSMLATHLSDILFGTPKAVRSEANLGILKKENVNIVLHGHEPLLSEKIVDVATSDEMVEYAKSKGAAGITLGGICCTGNEVLMRRGVGPAGNSLQQELAIATGVVDAMIVDVQCVFQGIVEAAKEYHTKIITTNERAQITGAEHIQFDEHNAEATAKVIVKEAIDNYANRKGDVFIPDHKSPMVGGFSHEYIRYILGGKMRAGLRPLNDAIISGRIQGAVAIVGCNNPRTGHDESTRYLVEEFVKRDIIVVMTGCQAIGAAKYGYMTPEAALEIAGPGLKEIAETVGIPPVLHMGSCVDNTRILTLLTDIVNEGGLGEDISDLPAVGIAPEWYSEKALEIALYCVASGAYVVFGGVQAPYRGSDVMNELTTKGFEEKFGARFDFFPTKEEILEASLNHIQAQRKKLGIDSQKERVLFDMEMRRELNV
jgi:carbon-monoxide dehydrogenase catalytic subunit